MKRSLKISLVIALAACAVGGAACKKEAEQAKPASGESGGGGDSSSQAGARAGADPAQRDSQLPAMPRKLPDGDLANPEARPERAEMRAKRDERRKEALETFDQNKNGELDDDERMAMHEARVADMVARMDTNADGKLTREELDASAATRRRPPPDFETIDANKDGFVTVEEMAAARPPRNFRDRRDQPRPPASDPPPTQPPTQP